MSVSPCDRLHIRRNPDEISIWSGRMFVAHGKCYAARLNKCVRVDGFLLRHGQLTADFARRVKRRVHVHVRIAVAHQDQQ